VGGRGRWKSLAAKWLEKTRVKSGFVFPILNGHGITATISLFSMKGQIHLDSGEVRSIPPDPIDLTYKAGLYAQDRAFVDAVARDERLTYPASDLADATRTMQLIEQIGGY
jgi:hypothetical protein